MREFFKPWRRKIGVLTLVMACVFAAGWFRSQTQVEYIDLSFGQVSCGVISMHSGLDFCRTTGLDPTSVSNFFDYKSYELYIDPKDPFNGTPWSADFQFDWRWDWAGFHIGEGQYLNRRHQDCMIPYWAIVIPLTLLSAWLLLTMPRPATAMKPT